MFTKDVKVQLSDLLIGREEALGSVFASLSAQGWVLIRLDEVPSKLIQNCIEPLKSFFALSEKEQFRVTPLWGYSSVSHEETFR